MVTVRESTKDDAHAVFNLLGGLGLIVPPKEKIEEYWDRLWVNNPFFAAYPGIKISGWIMEDDTEVVGFFGLIPRTSFLNGIPIPVAIASQWGVKKEYRQYTHLLSDTFFNNNPIALKLVTTAIKPTGRIFEKYDGRKVPASNLQNVYMVPFNLAKLVQYKIESSKRKLALFAFLLRLIPWKLQYLLISKDRNLQEVDVNNLPENYEDFWNNYLSNSKGYLASRDPATLNWFYLGDVRGLKKKVFLYRNDQEDIIGYAAIMEEPTINGSFKRFKIIDILSNDDLIKKRMIKALVHEVYKLKADVLEFHLPGQVDKSDIGVFTMNRQVASWPVFYQCTNSDENVTLENSDAWHISPFDGDTSLG
jgi:hypothetical protein